MRLYIKSIFSLKKIKYPLLSFFAYWTKSSYFERTTEIRSFVKLYYSKVGKYTRVNSHCQLVHTSIGNFSAIGKGTLCGLGRHPLNYPSTQSIFYKKNRMRNDWLTSIEYNQNLPINIGSDVWVGRNSTIMDGVTICDGAVIATGSIVTKNVPAYAIVGGVPAKVIKYRFSEDVIKRLIDLKWWDFSDEDISKNKTFFNESEVTVEIIDKYFKS